MEKKKKRSGGRSLGREMAFQVLYGLNFSHKDMEGMELAEFSYENFFSSPNKGGKKERAHRFARELIRGTLENIDTLDEIIERFSTNWKIERIARIELTILRLSIYEMLWRDDVPLKVAMDEGIELAKKFGDTNSRKFVNGILDAVGKAIINGELNPISTGEKGDGKICP